MTFDELKKEFKDNGFQIVGDSFVHEFEDPNTVINGVHPRKRFEMTYVCAGSIKTVTDDSDSDYDEEQIYQFDILGSGRKPVVTICVSNFKDFTVLAG